MKNGNSRKGWAFVLTLMMVFTTLFGGFSFLGLNGGAEDAYAADGIAYAEGAPAGTAGAELTYTIKTEDQLRALARTVSSGSGIKYEHTTFILQNDLSLTGGAWTPIGVRDIVFAGTFDGGDKTISGDLFNSDYQFFGLFGHTIGSTIKNLRVNVTITSTLINYVYVGGLVAMNKNGTIQNCSATAIIRGDKISRAGGLVGWNYGGTITNSSATGEVNSSNVSGGLVAENQDGTITNSSATGDVNSSNVTGGLVGENKGYLEHTGTIKNCYATGNVNGSNISGGLVGMNNENGIITNCYAEGNVNGKYVGGLVGINREKGLITNSYSAGTVTAGALSEVGGLVGENTGLITNCYSTGNVRGTTVGGLVGKNINVGKIENGYWNSTENSLLKGVGDGVDETTSMPSISMQAISFVEALNGNLNKLEDPTLYIWEQNSNVYPTFSTTLWGPVIVTCPGPVIGSSGTATTVANSAKYKHISTEWSGSTTGSIYVAGDIALAVITLEAISGYTFLNMAASSIRVAGGVVTYEKDQGVTAGGASVVFTVTYPQLIEWISLTSNGISRKETTTALALTFHGDPTSLITAEDIKVTGAKKGTLTGTGITRTLAISGITVLNGQNVTVVISNPSKFRVFPDTSAVVVYVKNKTPSKVSDTNVINTNTGVVTEDQFNKAIGAAKDGETVKINSTKTDEVIFPASGLTTLKEKTNALAVITKNGTLTFDSKAVNAMTDKASGKEIKLSMKDVDKTTLTKEQQAKVGDRKIYDLNVMSGDMLISSFDGGKVTVSIPYLVNPEETTEDIGVWYMADDGSLTYIKCVYDPKAKSVTFTVDHFSKYVIGYYGIADWMKPFSDVKSGAWYYDAVAYVNMKSLMKGNSITSFEPQGLMTRGMVVTILGRMEAVDITTYEKSETFSDVSSSQYYAPYIEWAKAQGIVSGVGNDKFAPNSGVTREDMAVIITNYLKFKGQGPVGDWAIHLKYSDLDKISPWAGEGVMFVTMKGLMKGVGNDDEGNPLFAPGITSTRAQAAQVLMSLGELKK